MADAGFFKGTSADQDRRFSDKELKLLKSIKFPPEFDKKVDMKKVNVQVIRPWIAKKVTDLVGFEDEVVVEYAMGLLEDPNHTTPDPKKMQINLTGFLTSSTPVFMTALWSLLLEAQDSPAGVPKTFVEEKKEEMRKARDSDQRAFGERDRRARFDEIREKERAERGGRGRGRGRGRARGGFDGGGRGRDGGWGGRGGGRQGRRFSSRSPPPQRRRSPSASPFDARSSRSPPPPPGRRSRTPQRYSSPSARRSRSRSPPVQRSHRRFSRSPSPRRRPRSPSVTPSRDGSRPRSQSPPTRRRRRSPSHSRSPPRRYSGGKDRRRDSRSPPPRRRRYSRSPTPPSSRSPTPPSPRYGRRRSPSPRGGHKGRRESPSRSRTSPSRRRNSRERDRTAEEIRRTRRSPSPAAMDVDKADTRLRTLDSDLPQNSRGELKIKGQANAARSRWEDDEKQGKRAKGDGVAARQELEQRENELKERALRNKVIRTRKGSGGIGASSG